MSVMVADDRGSARLTVGLALGGSVAFVGNHAFAEPVLQGVLKDAAEDRLPQMILRTQ